MVIDDLASASEWVRRLCRDAHVIRVPFPIYPFDDADGSPGLLWTTQRLPRGLIPTDRPDDRGRIVTSLARPPYPSIVLMSETAELGALFVSSEDANATAAARRLEGEHARGAFSNPENLSFFRSARVFVEATLIGFTDRDRSELLARPCAFAFTKDDLLLPHPVVSLVITYLESIGVPVVDAVAAATGESDIARMRPESMDELVRYFVTLNSIASAKINGGSQEDVARISDAYRDVPIDEVRSLAAQRLLDNYNVQLSAVTACSLMNCRNIVMEEVTPTGQRARIRRGEPPLYSYKVLKVRPFLRRRSAQRAGELSDVTESVAIHWRRGHFKHYTADRPLLGRHTGLFWWQPHLAGRAPRVADKDYSLDTHRVGD